MCIEGLAVAKRLFAMHPPASSAAPPSPKIPPPPPPPPPPPSEVDLIGGLALMLKAVFGLMLVALVPVVFFVIWIVFEIVWGRGFTIM